MYMCIYVYMHKYINTYIHTYMHACIHTYMHTYAHTYIHTYIHTYTCMHACMHACMHVYIPTYLQTYLHTYPRTYVRTYTPTCMHTYIHTYIHIYIRIHMHMHIHMLKKYNIYIDINKNAYTCTFTCWTHKYIIGIVAFVCLSHALTVLCDRMKSPPPPKSFRTRCCPQPRLVSVVSAACADGMSVFVCFSQSANVPFEICCPTCSAPRA